MKIAVYSTKQYDKKYLQHVNENRQRLRSGVYLRQ